MSSRAFVTPAELERATAELDERLLSVIRVLEGVTERLAGLEARVRTLEGDAQ